MARGSPPQPLETYLISFVIGSRQPVSLSRDHKRSWDMNSEISQIDIFGKLASPGGKDPIYNHSLLG